MSYVYERGTSIDKDYQTILQRHKRDDVSAMSSASMGRNNYVEVTSAAIQV